MGWFKGFSKKQTTAKGFQGQKSSQVLQLQTFILEPILTPSGIIDTDDHSHDLVLDVDTPILPEIDLADNDLPDADDTSDVATSLGSDLIDDATDVTDIADTHIVDDSILDQDLEEISFFDPTDTTDTASVDDGDVVNTGNIDQFDNLDIADEINDDIDPVDNDSIEVAIADSTSEDSATDTDIDSPEIVADHNNSDIDSPEIIADNSDTDIDSPEIVADTSDTDIDSPEIIADNSDSDIDSPEIIADNSDSDIVADNTDELDPISDNLDITEIPEIIDPPLTFSSGVFTVGETGEVEVDFLFDGGGYKGEVAIFSLRDMDSFTPGSTEFIKEAATRALSNSDFGHVVISDITEAARFSGNLPGEGNQNSGIYLGVKPFQMLAGDEFGVMLVPNGTLQQLFNNPNAGGALRPLFSLVTANPNDHFHIGQIADVTGDGNTFVMEDLRVDTGSDRDYNDIIFQVRGASGQAAKLDDLIAANRDWRGSQLGQELISYTMPPVDETPIVTPPVDETPIVTPPVDETPIVTPPVDETPIVTPPVDETPIVTPPVDETPIVTPPVDETPIVTPPVDETPIVTPPVDKTPIVTPPVDKTPIVTPPVDETPIVTPPVDKTPIVTPPVDETPIVTPPVDETPIVTPPVDETPIVTPPVDETPIVTPPVDETPIVTPPVDETPIVTPPTPPEPIVTPPVDETPIGTQLVFLTERIWNNADNRQHLLNAFSQSNDSRFIGAIDILQSYVTQENPDLTGLQAQLSEQLPTLTQALTDPSNQAVLQALETNIVAITPGAGAPTEAVAQIFVDTIERYGGAGRVGNAIADIVRIGNGYIQEFNFGGAGAGAILYGDGNEQAIFLAGEEWQEFQAQGGVLTQGYLTQHQLPVEDTGTPTIELPAVDLTPGGEGNVSPNDEAPIAQPLNGLISPNDFSDTAGNTTSTARSITLGQTISERVSDTDVDDFYRFNVNERTRVDLRISGMSADADLYLLDANGNQISYSAASSNADDAISQELNAGTYFVKVHRFSGNTDYNLTTAGQVVDTAGNSTSAARDITLGQTISERVSDADVDDFYRFNVNERTRVDLRISGMSADADLRLLDANGNQLAVSAAGGNADDAISQELNAGTYFVRVNRYSGNTDYNLTTAGQVVDTAGNSTSAARDITLGQTISERVSDTDVDDFYRFNVNERTRVDLRISGMSADADLRLLDANGNQLAVSAAGGNADDAISQELNAGTYFVRVNRYSGNTDYNLTTAGQVVDTAGNSTSAARAITLGQTISERVSDADVDDFYRFNVNERTRVDLRISGMSADADLYLLDANGNQISYSAASSNADDAISQELNAGTYFVKVHRFSGNTDYNLITAGQVVQTNRAPVVTAVDQSVHLNRSISPAFTVTDPDQNPITRYRFQDLNGTAGTGYFTVNGVAQNANQSIEVAANQLNTVQFVGGSSIGGNNVQVAAFDGQLWSNWTNFNIATTNNAPVMSATTPQTVNVNQTIFPQFTASDPDGDAMTLYFYDGNSNANSGYFTLNGVRQSANQYIPVSSQQLSSLRWVGGSVAGEDNISAIAYDGNAWSNWTNFALVTDTAGNTRNQARSITLGQALPEYVSSNDREDFYQFTVNSPGRVTLGLSGMTADADIELQDANGNRLTSSNIRGSSNDSLTWNLAAAGTYFVRVNQFSGNTNYNLTTNWQATAAGPRFTNFSVTDASGDGTTDAVFQRGALQLNWGTDVTPNSVRTFARNNTTGAVTELFYDSNRLVNLNNQNLAAGNYTIYAEARDASGNVGRSADIPMRVLAFSTSNANSLKIGSFTAETHSFSGASEGSVFIGRGGNDVLSLSGISSSNVTFDPNRRTIFGGTTFDWLRINSTGQEIYFQGYDRLQFSNSTINLGVTPNDPLFSQQWNLGMTDVSGAWRFTTGSQNVLLGIADSGLNLSGGQSSHPDLNGGRSIIDSSDQDALAGQNGWGHGTSVQSIVAADTNDGVGIAGINWSSPTYVSNVFGSRSFSEAAQEQIDYARARGQKVVFNLSAEYTIDVNDTALANLMQQNADTALFVIASGNSANRPTNVVSKPADFAGQYGNVMAVGAVGGDNGNSATRHSYSQYGSQLTLVAPSGVPAARIPSTTITDGQGNVYDIVSDPSFYPITARKRSDGQLYTFSGFSGTSAATPNVSGVASLVWSANTSLIASEVRNILTSTANRVWQTWGGSNSDNQYGAGLIDAEAAVRRADALNRNRNLASLFNNQGLFFA